MGIYDKFYFYGIGIKHSISQIFYKENICREVGSEYTIIIVLMKTIKTFNTIPFDVSHNLFIKIQD